VIADQALPSCTLLPTCSHPELIGFGKKIPAPKHGDKEFAKKKQSKIAQKRSGAKQRHNPGFRATR